jgi:hypothetical protein
MARIKLHVRESLTGGIFRLSMCDLRRDGNGK